MIRHESGLSFNGELFCFFLSLALTTATATRIAPRNLLGYTCFRDSGLQAQGLEKSFLTGSKAGIQAQHAERLRLILGRLNISTTPEDMNLPGLSLHQLKGARKGTWAVKVSGNWRVTFVFVRKDTDDVDYKDYH